MIMNLFSLSIRTRWRMLTEYLNVVCTDYRNSSYRKADLNLLRRYIFDTPFTISKQWALAHGLEQIYTYGETPIPGLRKIIEECEITDDDHVYELGCGRGRACIWLRHIVNCNVTGIECIGEFIRRTKDLEDDKLSFIEDDFLEADLGNATVIYLNGTMLSRIQIQKLSKKLSTLRSGTKVVTVSYPLNQYSKASSFEMIKEFPVKFHWGTGSVYLQAVT